ncbi:acetyl-coenzyme A carboxylase carboxyl transferase subunit alpha [Geobacter sp. OR-1]|nr:acetyl-coenzyme A carboxylase carboxyl transferase subunit alpha [Geobacter sp. OR-1]
MGLQNFYMEFEKPLVELEKKIEELREMSGDSLDLATEIGKLEKKAEKVRAEIFSGLSRWQTAQVARHPNRPFTLDYLNMIFTDFIELHGDRLFGDDHAIVAGLAKLDGEPVMVIGHQKGRDTKEKVYRNFGMPNPEGYRKALRLMGMAEQFRLPIITFVDTPGAYPGIGAEERGQAEAIARNLREMAALTVPIIVVITGEGGIRRRAGHCCRRPGADAGAFGVCSYLPRGVRGDPLVRRHQGCPGRRSAQAHGQRYQGS